MKSKFVQVTTWTSSEHHPDLTRGHWVMFSLSNIVTYILTGLWTQGLSGESISINWV